MVERNEKSEAQSTRQERDLYRRLLELGTETELEPFLKEALTLVVDVTGARQGYLELRDGGAPGGKGTPDGEADWWIAHGCSDSEVEDIRAAVSQGIIAEATATGETIVTASALLDPRFRERLSVQLGRIEAVLCAPIGGDPSCGVLYLQGGGEAGPFDGDDQARAELFARHLAPLADRLLARARARDEADATREVRGRLRLDGLVGRSPALAAVLEQAALVAPLDVNVLITGDSGTGKSQLARLMHDNGPRAAHPFVELNCAALPEALLENELFGAVAGAHSTASRDIAGKVAAAERGTLFLDEIGELPVSAQAKLLQLLQSREYFPLGAKRAVTADIRLVAATNADLAAAVKAQRFREDLFYRLQVLPLRMPSLAERREDIRELAEFFCHSASERHKLASLDLSRRAVLALEAAEWPGNVRQLAHAVEASVIRAAGEGVTQVERRHVFPGAPEAAGEEEALTFQEATRCFQRDLLSQTLTDTGWNVAETARRLDLARSHIYNLINAFGLERSDG